MKVIIMVETPGGHSIARVADIQEAELAGAVAVAFDAFREAYPGAPLLDFSTVRIERA